MKTVKERAALLKEELISQITIEQRTKPPQERLADLVGDEQPEVEVVPAWTNQPKAANRHLTRKNMVSQKRHVKSRKS